MLINSLKYYNESVEPLFDKVKGLNIYELNRYMDLLENRIESESRNINKPQEILIELYSKFSKKIFKELSPNKKIFEITQFIEPSYYKDIVIPIYKVLEQEDFCKKNNIIIKEDIENVDAFLIAIETFKGIIAQEVSLQVTNTLNATIEEEQRLPINEIDDTVVFNRLPNKYK